MIVLLLHCEGGDGTTNFVDSSYPPVTVESKGGARISASNYKFGSSCGLFEGGGEKNILRLHFDDEIGSSVFSDTSPLSSELNINGNPVISSLPSVWGNCALFDGSSSLSDLSQHYVIYNDMSFDVYLLFDQVDTRQNILSIDKDHERGLEFYFDPNQIFLRFGDTIISADWLPTIGQWYMVSISRSGAYIYIRIDGKEVARGFRKTGLTIQDSILKFSNPNIPLYSPIFFSRYLPGPITAIEFDGDIPSSVSAFAHAKQNISITEEELVDSLPLTRLSEVLLGLEGRVYIGLYLASMDGSQISIDNLFLHYSAPESYDGTLTKIQINKYEGSESSDVLLKIPTNHLSDSNLSNTLFRIDQEPTPYSVLYSNPVESCLIINSQNKRDNLTTHLNLGTEVHWNSVGLLGSSLDWGSSNGGVKQTGYWKLSEGYWMLDQDGGLSSIESTEKFSFLVCMKSINSGTFTATISVGDIVWEIKFNDSVPFVILNGEEYEKPSMPWGNTDHLISIQKYLDSLIFKIDDLVITTLSNSLSDEEEIKIAFTEWENSGKVGVRGYYTGPLVYGNSKTDRQSDLDYTYLTNDPPLATGYMLYAGIADLDSVGLLFITKHHVFLDKERLDVPLPPDLSANSKILGFQDMKTTNSILLYGSEDKTYYFDDEWKLLGNFKLIDVYKDQWGEGIVYQENSASYWVQMFERLDNKLTLTGDKSLFSVIPTDVEYKLESTIDYRKRKGTIPWIWIRKRNE